MTTTAKLLTCCLVVTLSLAAAPAAMAQSGQNVDRAQYDQHLQQARRALTDGNLDEVEFHIQQAEQSGVKSNPLFAPFADTPDKLRKELEKARRSGAAANRPSSRFLPPVRNAASTQPASQADPFQRRDTERRDTEGAVTLLTDNAQPSSGPSTVEMGPSGADPRLLRPADVQDLPDPIPAAMKAAPVTLPPAAQVVMNPHAATQGDRSSAFGSAGRPAADVVTPDPHQARRQQAVQLLTEAQLALDRGQIDMADRLTRQADALQVPDTAFQPGDPRPGMMLMMIARARSRTTAPVAQAGGGNYPATATPYDGRAAVYQPSRDASRTVPAQNLAPPPAQDLTPPPATARQDSPGNRLYQQGLQALKERHDRDGARELFRQAWQYEAQLDPAVRSQLQQHLQLLNVPNTLAAPPAAEASPLEAIDSQQQLLLREAFNDVQRETSAARTQSATDPLGAKDRLMNLRQRVAQTELDPNSRRQLLLRVDRHLAELDRFIEQNRSQIELDAENRQVRQDVEQWRSDRLGAQQKLAEMVEQFNTLMEEQRYSEAVVLAKQARELDPENPVVVNMLETSRFAERIQSQFMIRERSVAGFDGQMDSVQDSATPFDDRDPYRLPDLRVWEELTGRRQRWMRDRRTRLSEKELAIQQSLKEPVDVQFEQRPLQTVIDELEKLAGVNIHLDAEGLAAEGVTTDTPVNLSLQHPISLKSALALILQPLHLSYVIQNEVLLVTSEQTSDENTFVEVYNVADLVIPIPNFIPSHNIGLPGNIHDAIRSQGGGFTGGIASRSPMTLLAGNESMGTGGNASVLAQLANGGSYGGPSGGARAAHPVGVGPGGLGGGAQADFDTLTELITSTVAPTTWDEVGGPGSIAGFDTNLSLVVSQTQEVHEQIVDLLEQLRRLQDLQVTIEVRFITLNDNFFERIGVDFDFRIDDNSGLDNDNPAFPDDTGPSITFGLDPNGGPTADLDLQFTQDSFGVAIPQFGGFGADTAANFGFAILSDIEAFFLIQAAQGDVRTNVMQAPKVTLFNGQQAFVSDTSQRPFVTSIIPVVGDFAAAQQPVIVVLNEGTSLSVQAVVSQDRRFVRLTLVPFFSRIGDVDEFTFEGTTTSRTGTTVIDPTDPTNVLRDDEEIIQQGTTVQLPTFAFTTVTTTVSVPDGGTILLGGIKRLSEGRNEQGVPVLSKMPYINRLFKNVGIGRDSQSLMLMVTPRIIIQEEEEALLGLTP